MLTANERVCTVHSISFNTLKDSTVMVVMFVVLIKFPYYFWAEHVKVDINSCFIPNLPLTGNQYRKVGSYITLFIIVFNGASLECTQLCVLTNASRLFMLYKFSICYSNISMNGTVINNYPLAIQGRIPLNTLCLPIFSIAEATSLYNQLTLNGDIPTTYVTTQ